MKTFVTKEDVERCADIIKNNGLVAVPTETVYGLAGNGLSEIAVDMIYDVKGRPAVKPLSLMVSGSNSIEKYCYDVPQLAYKFADKYWPGPLTIVLKSKDIVPSVVRAGGSTVGLRCPDHRLTLALLEKSEVPFAAPSANPSGEESPKNAEKVVEYFEGKIEAVLDGGECGIGKESTIIDLSALPYKVLRWGALSKKDILNVLLDDISVIGITGGTGCGKTTALNVLEDKGALIIDCDEMYHEMIETDEKMISTIVNEFPDSVSDGKFERKNLGKIVFGNEQLLDKLNNITHSYIISRIEDKIFDYAMNGGKIVAIDAVALIESGLNTMCDFVLGVTADKTIRAKRIMSRDNISEEYALMRINAQQSDDFYIANCNRVLENNGSVNEFRTACESLYKEILK